MGSDDGRWLALGATGVVVAAALLKERGSRAPLGHQDGIDLLAFREELGFRAADSIPMRRVGSRSDGPVLRQGRARANVGLMWKLMSDKVYGTWVDLPVIATREALQNSRDAIDAAWRAGKIKRNEGRFTVQALVSGGYPRKRSITWEDNGLGMDEDTFYDKFLSLGETTKGLAGRRECRGVRHRQGSHPGAQFDVSLGDAHAGSQVRRGWF